MSFKAFMYYCALCGGWAALFVWGIQEFAGVQTWTNGWYITAAVSALLGLLLGGAIGLLDALLNSNGFQRLLRLLICLAIGFGGSLVAGLIGEGIKRAVGGPNGPRFIGWMLVGVVIGLAIAVFDLLRAMTGKGMGQAIKKAVKGIVGGAIGGFIGGFLQDSLATIGLKSDTFPKSSLAIGLVILGLCIGLLIGLAQVLLKEAWVRVEKGFKAGREMILSKPETNIGRAEGMDIPLFGDMGVEKTHARIVLRGDRYVLVDAGTPGGTFVNGERISGPYPLSNGDLIQMGRSEVRFEERKSRK